MTNKTLEIGNVMEDGTIFAGISPHTKKPMYVAPTDALDGLLMKFNEATKYAKGFELGGKKDFRIPSRKELYVISQNLTKGALKGTFNLTGVFPNGIYWSREPFYCFFFDAKTLRMADGKKCHYNKGRKLSTRLIRG